MNQIQLSNQIEDSQQLISQKSNNIGSKIIIKLQNINTEYDKKKWNRKNNKDLRIENLEIEKGTLNIIIGKKGSGKRSLLNLIQKKSEIEEVQENLINSRNMILQDRNVIIMGNVGILNNNLWLQEKKVRENILMGKELDEEMMSIVIGVFELEGDMDKSIEELNDNQKQRITMARAIYQDCDIYLLHNHIFSLQSFNQAKRIFDKLIKYLIDLKSKTVLLILNKNFKQFYSSSPKCNFIYLHQRNHISDPLLIQSYVKKLLKKNYQPQILNSSNIQNQNNFNNFQEIINTHSLVLKQVNKQTILSYLKDYNIFIVSFFLILNILMVLSSIFIDYWLKDLISLQIFKLKFMQNINDYFGDKIQNQFFYFIIILLIISLITNIICIIGSKRASKLKFEKINEKLINQKQIFYQKNQVEKMMDQLNNDIQIIDTEVPWYFHESLNSILKILCISIILSIIYPWNIIIFIVQIWFFIYLTNIFQLTNNHFKRLNNLNQNQINSFFNDVIKLFIYIIFYNFNKKVINGLEIIKCFKKQKKMLDEFIQKINLSNKSNYLENIICIFVQFLLQFLALLLLISTILSSTFYIYLYQDIDYLQICFAFTQSLLITEYFIHSNNYINQLSLYFVSVERIRKFDYLKEFENLSIITPIHRQIDQMDTIQIIKNEFNDIENYSIIFQNVSLTFDDKKTFALKNFNLAIKKGEKIAIYGKSGSGKSSIINVLFRLYDIDEGNIIVNQQQIHEISLQDLRKQIKIIGEQSFIFKGTLKENIDPENCSSLETVKDIMRQINQNQYLNMMIEEEGKNLSEQEKQIINFLRNCIKDQSIICLDQATSQMDSETEESVYEYLFKMAQNKTLIVISNKIKNSDQYDRVIVIDQGRIVEQRMKEKK